MKKEYIKPYLAVESFQLDAAIAGSCTGKMILAHSVNDCTLVDDKGINWGDIYFGEKCGTNVVAPDACYQAMTYSTLYLES